MKKITTVCAIAVAAVCAVGFSGCSSSSSTTASLSSNWYVRTSYTGIQPAAVYADNGNVKEVLTYDITFVEDSGSNSNYSVSYNDGGTMTTEFYAQEYDWSNADIPEEYRSDDTETLYVYTTDFTVSGTYTFTETGETYSFEDTMTSVCYFRSVRHYLAPVYSYKFTKCTSPISYMPSVSGDMVRDYEYTYTVYYNQSATEAISYYKDLLTDETDEIKCDLSESENNLYDNSSLYAVMRAMNFSSSTSQSVDIFIPVENGYSTYVLGGSDSATLEDEGIKNALVNAGYASSEDEIGYTAATITLSADLTGTTQTVWYASVTDSDSNQLRSTMLKISLPLSYSLGTLEFSLSAVNSSLNV